MQSASAAESDASTGPPKLNFYMDGHLLPHNATVFHCIQKHTDFSKRKHQLPSTRAGRSSKFWNQTCVLEYKLREEGDAEASEGEVKEERVPGM